MREIKIGTNENGQKLIRLLGKYLKKAPGSFLHKMLRKKNIVLNDHKADGSEVLSYGDTVKLYLSEETALKFGAPAAGKADTGQAAVDIGSMIVYEDEQVLIVNKPAGMLSQKARESDMSLVDLITAHLIQNGSLTSDSLASFRPGIVSRLDRNTSGLVTAGKTVRALQLLNELAREHMIGKYYNAIVHGELTDEAVLEGYWIKDHRDNTVRILHKPQEGAVHVLTRVMPVSCGISKRTGRSASYVRVELLTGKSHQIRAHLAAAGHPLWGDVKYGACRESYRRGHLLHAGTLVFPEFSDEQYRVLEGISGKHFTADLPDDFKEALHDLDMQED